MLYLLWSTSIFANAISSPLSLSDSAANFYFSGIHIVLSSIICAAAVFASACCRSLPTLCR